MNESEWQSGIGVEHVFCSAICEVGWPANFISTESEMLFQLNTKRGFFNLVGKDAVLPRLVLRAEKGRSRKRTEDEARWRRNNGNENRESRGCRRNAGRYRREI